MPITLRKLDTENHRVLLYILTGGILFTLIVFRLELSFGAYIVFSRFESQLIFNNLYSTIFSGFLFGLGFGSFSAFQKYQLPHVAYIIPASIVIFILGISFTSEKIKKESVFIMKNKKTVEILKRAQIEFCKDCFEIQASSTWPPKGDNHYNVGNLLLENDSKAWISGNSEDDKNLTYTFIKFPNNKLNQLHVGFLFSGGYFKTKEHWNMFNRPDSIEVFKNYIPVAKLFISESENRNSSIWLLNTKLNSGDKIKFRVIPKKFHSGKYKKNVAVSKLIPMFWK